MAITRVNPADWSVGDKLTSAQANAIDANCAKALDKTVAGDTLSGDVSVASGGSIVLLSGSEITVNAGAEIDVGGALLVANSATTQVDMGTGSFIAVSSGSNITTGGTGYVKFNNTDWPKLNTRTRSVIRNALDCARFVANSTIWTRALGQVLGPATTGELLQVDMPTHDGATLSSINVYFVPSVHVALPASPPQLIIYVSDTTGAVVSTQTVTFTLPGIVGLYSATPQTWTATLSPALVLSPGTYFYTIFLQDEHGANSVSGNSYFAFKFNYTAIADMRFP